MMIQFKSDSLACLVGVIFEGPGLSIFFGSTGSNPVVVDYFFGLFFLRGVLSFLNSPLFSPPSIIHQSLFIYLLSI